MGAMRNSRRILVGKPEEKELFGRPRSGWEGNIETDLKEIECEDVDCINVAENKVHWWILVNKALNRRVP